MKLMMYPSHRARGRSSSSSSACCCWNCTGAGAPRPGASRRHPPRLARFRLQIRPGLERDNSSCRWPIAKTVRGEVCFYVEILARYFGPADARRSLVTLGLRSLPQAHARTRHAGAVLRLDAFMRMRLAVLLDLERLIFTSACRKISTWATVAAEVIRTSAGSRVNLARQHGAEAACALNHR